MPFSPASFGRRQISTHTQCQQPDAPMGRHRLEKKSSIDETHMVSDYHFSVSQTMPVLPVVVDPMVSSMSVEPFSDNAMLQQSSPQAELQMGGACYPFTSPGLMPFHESTGYSDDLFSSPYQPLLPTQQHNQLNGNFPYTYPLSPGEMADPSTGAWSYANAQNSDLVDSGHFGYASYMPESSSELYPLAPLQQHWSTQEHQPGQPSDNIIQGPLSYVQPGRLPYVEPPEIRTRFVMLKPKSEALKKELDIDQRLNYLELLISSAQKLFDTAESERGYKDRVYIGPEYFFDQETASQKQPDHYKIYKRNIMVDGEFITEVKFDTDRQLTEPEKQYIVERIKQISVRYPSITIMPGSIAWMKPLNRAESRGEYLQRKLSGSTEPGKVQYYQQKYTRKQGGNEKSDAPVNLPSLNSHHRYWKAKRAINKAKANFPDEVYDPLTANCTHMVRNTSYVFRAGGIVAKHHKTGDSHEVRKSKPDEKRIFVPGEIPGRFVLPGGETVTIEICMDNKLDIVSHPQYGVQSGDIHIVQSDAIDDRNHESISQHSKVIAHASTLRNTMDIGIFTPPVKQIHGVRTFTLPGHAAKEIPKLDDDDNVELYEP